MVCKLQRVRQSEIGFEEIIYTCDDVREKADEWKADFRKKNATDEIHRRGGKDSIYDAYCQDIDDFLKGCKCLSNSLAIHPDH